MRNRLALWTIAAATILDTAVAIVFSHVEHHDLLDGLYWAVTTATTVGYGDITPHTGAGKLLAIFVMLTIVPLISATFSLFTSALTSNHVKDHVTESEKRIKAHVTEHHDQLRRDLSSDR